MGRVALYFPAPVALEAGRNATCGKWQVGEVMPCRATDCPVKMLARVGEQSGLEEYARVNVIPRAANRAMFGVL